MPTGATESYKKILKKRARNYKVSARLFFCFSAYLRCENFESDESKWHEFDITSLSKQRFALR
jgi:hypothetical protein